MTTETEHEIKQSSSIHADMRKEIVDIAFEIQKKKEPQFFANKYKINSFVEASMTNTSMFLVAVVIEDELAGFMMGVATTPIFINDIVIMDSMMHVKEKFRERQPRVAPILMGQFEEWGRTIGATAAYLVKYGKRAKMGSQRFGYVNQERHGIKLLK
jgi:hypothetical protein